MPSLRRLDRHHGDTWPAVAITRGLAGIASLGSVLLAESRREDRLLALLSFRHVVVLPAAALVPNTAAIAPLMRRWLGRHRFITAVTGPSRTSDIERVLTIGVHGPPELVIVLVDGWEPADA
jgi:L-lactate dehydrogenase complex protein LldG